MSASTTKQTSTYQLIGKNLKIAIATSIISQPFEVLRTSMILTKNISNNINMTGFTEMCKMVIKNEGFLGFFRGSQIAVLKNSLGAVIFFSGIENISKKSKEIIPLTQISPFQLSVLNFWTACCSKFITTIAVNPLTIIKTKLEVIGCQKYRGGMHCAMEIWRKEGISGFQRGFVPTILRDVPFSGLQYAIYQCMLRFSGKFDDNPTANSKVVLTCGATSSIMAIMLTYPFDNLRVRWQAGDSKYSLIKTTMNVYASEGLRGFYKGYLPRIMKKGCSGGILWTLYEKFSQEEKSLV